MINAKADEPKNLTTQMLRQLDMVAEEHGGEVPLHGRLFSQWLHYAFPYECTYPRLRSEKPRPGSFSGTEAHEEEKRKYTMSMHEEEAEAEAEAPTTPAYMESQAAVFRGKTDAENNAEEDEELMSQWTMEEELYAGQHVYVQPQQPGTRRS